MTKSIERRLDALNKAAAGDEQHEVRVGWDKEDSRMPPGLRRWRDPETGELHIRLFWDDDLEAVLIE